MSKLESRIFPADAQWIWHPADPAPRNGWFVFRAQFPGGGPDAAMSVTADSRYTVSLNGTRVGEGPVRGFHGAYHVDRWPVGHLLQETNSIEVLVHHTGVATFSHPLGRGGLLLAVVDGDHTLALTDEAWTVAVHGGYSTRSCRISPQLGFSEVLDARWSIEQADWQPAIVIGPEGTAPWGTLVPRDIPALVEESVRPVSVSLVASATTHHIGATIDARNLFAPETLRHADVVAYAGYIGTVVELDAASTLEVSLPHGRAHFRVNAVHVGGQWIERDDMTHETAMGRDFTIQLPAGAHPLLIETALADHGYPLALQISADACTPRVRAPRGTDAPSGFVAFGPVAQAHADPRTRYAHPSVVAPDIPAGARDEAVAVLADDADRPGAVPVPIDLVDPCSVYGDNVHPRSRRTAAVPAAIRALAAGQASTIPVIEGESTEIVVDLGHETSGYFDFEITANEGTVLDLYGFEYLHEGVREDTQECTNALRYIAREGRQTYRSQVRRGVRFLQIAVRNATAPVVIHRVEVIASHYPVSRAGDFRSSDATLTRAWEISRQTLITCMEDAYVDCPVYEQAFWVGDSYSSSRFAATMFDVSDLNERCLRLVARSAAQTPLLNSQVPSGWTNVIPNWSFLWVIASRDHWFRTADARFAADSLQTALSALAAFDDHVDERGLLSITAWNFLDWAQLDQSNSGVVTHQQMLAVLAWAAAADLADAAGDSDAAARARARSVELRDAATTHLWDAEAQAYIDSISEEGRRSTRFSQQTQLFALLAEAGDPARLDRLGALVEQPPADWTLIASPWLAIFLYDALAARGRTQLAVDDIREKYGLMLDHGATTTWETYPGSTMSHADRVTRSHCHAWSAAPAAFLPERVLGIRATAPGWHRVRIEPFAGDLTWASGSVPVPFGGQISVSWRRDGSGRISARIDAPAGVEIDIAPEIDAAVNVIAPL